ncbi:hypothetical protein AAHH67_02105 [Niallia circulans]
MSATLTFPKAKYSTAGITYLMYQKPSTVAWWSAVFLDLVIIFLISMPVQHC